MRTALAFVLVSGLLVTAARAQAPAGVWGYQFGPENPPMLWSFSGEYSAPTRVTWYHTGAGRIESDLGYLGRVSGKYPNIRARAKIRDVWYEPYGWFLGTNHVRLYRVSVVLDTNQPALAGTYSCDERLFRVDLLTTTLVERSRWADSITLPLQPTSDGGWSLSIELTSVENRLTGNATITYPHGWMNSFFVKGKDYPTKQKARLLLKGLEGDRGASLSLMLSTPAMNIEWMKGTVAGQRVRFP